MNTSHLEELIIEDIKHGFQPFFVNATAGTTVLGAFDDIDGDVLSLTAALSNGDALPLWLSFDGTTFTGTPPSDFNGSLAIVVTGSDGQSEVSDTFLLTINPINDAPVLAQPLSLPAQGFHAFRRQCGLINQEIHTIADIDDEIPFSARYNLGCTVGAL